MVLKVFPEKNLPGGRTLMIHPPYVHYTGGFVRDSNPYLPVGLLYAGQALEDIGIAEIQYHDAQLHDLKERTDLFGFDSFGINVMGTQNISAAYWIYNLLRGSGIDPNRVYFGGQGVEGLLLGEFSMIFPNAHQTNRSALSRIPGYWEISLEEQLGKFSEEDLRNYLKHESTLLFSQGCLFNCDFCGAQTGRRETFYNTEENLRTAIENAKRLGINNLDFYCTSLDFFQDVLRPPATGELEKRLRAIKDLQVRNGVNLRMRALTRADSYMHATKFGLVDMAKDSGFYQFGFGADGAADIRLLRAIHKGDNHLETRLFKAFEHAEKRGISPEILYVFGIPEDTDETLQKTRELCIGLLSTFGKSIYRGFPAKNEIPGNANWTRPEFKKSDSYRRLLQDPQLFLNLGFETLANQISHPNPELRKRVNRCAVEMSRKAHELGRVQSFLTIPLMDTDGSELMGHESFDSFREIVRNYAPEIANRLTLENLSEYRVVLNRRIPKDK